jgi:hypothetical protein
MLTTWPQGQQTVKKHPRGGSNRAGRRLLRVTPIEGVAEKLEDLEKTVLGVPVGRV